MVNKIVYRADIESIFPIVAIKLTLWVPIPSWYIFRGLKPMNCNMAIRFIKIDEMLKYKIYFFLNSPKYDTYRKDRI